jgi:hypothetical protein
MAFKPLVCDRSFPQGYWWNNSIASEALTGALPPDSLVVFPCPNSKSCQLLNGTLSVCAPGYKGVLCGQCEAGFGRASNGVCAQCFHPGEFVWGDVRGLLTLLFAAVSWALLMLVVGIVVTGGAMGVMRVVGKRRTIDLQGGLYKRELTGTVKILFNFLQTVSFLGDFNLHWPDFVSSLFSTGSSLSGFSAEAAFVSCALGWSPTSKFLTVLTLIPTIVIIPAIVIWLINWWHRRTEALLAAEDEDYIPVPLAMGGVTPLNLYTTSVMVVLFLLYPTVTRQAILMLACTDEIEGVRYMTADMSIMCGSEEHKTMENVGWATIVLFTIGFPILCVVLMWPYRHRLDSDKARRRYAFLYSGYRPERFWYESIIMSRKAAVAAVSVLLRTNSTGMQLWTGLLVQLSFLAVHIALHPFKDKLQGWLEQGCVTVGLAIMVIGQSFVLPGFTESALVGSTFAVVSLTILTALTCLVLIIYDIVTIVKDANIADRVMGALVKPSPVKERAQSKRRVIIGSRSPSPPSSPVPGPPVVESNVVRPGFWEVLRGARGGRPKANSLGYAVSSLPSIELPKMQPKRTTSIVGSIRNLSGRRTVADSSGWKSNSLKDAVRAASVVAAFKVHGEAETKQGADAARPTIKIPRDVSSRAPLARDDAASSRSMLIRTRSRASFGEELAEGNLLASSPWTRETRQSLSAKITAAALRADKRRRASLPVSEELKLRRKELEATWREAVHPKTGMSYWYNKTTRQTTWELPPELEALERAEQADILLWERKEHPKKHIAFWVHPTQGHQWKRPVNVPLQPGEEWWRTMHPSTGVPYFVNLLTRETSWEKPEIYVFTPRQFVHPSLEPLIATLESSQAAVAESAGSFAAAARSPSVTEESPGLGVRRRVSSELPEV